MNPNITQVNRRDNDDDILQNESTPTLQSGPCDLLRIPKTRKYALIAHFINTEGGDKVVHFSCEANEVVEAALVPRIIAVTERAIYKFPISSAADATSFDTASSFSFEERRFAIANVSELVAIDGSDGDLQGHSLQGLDVQVFGTTDHTVSSADAADHRTHLKFVLNFGELIARRQAFLLNISMINPDVPIMQKQRIKKLAAQQAGARHDSPSSSPCHMENAMRDENRCGASPARSLLLDGATKLASPAAQTETRNSNWMSPDALKATAAAKRRAAAAKARAANKIRVHQSQPPKSAADLESVFARLSQSGSDRGKSSDGHENKMKSPGTFNAQRRAELEREENELPPHLRPEFYADIERLRLREKLLAADGGGAAALVAAAAAKATGGETEQRDQEKCAGARSLLFASDGAQRRVVLPPCRELDDNDFSQLQAAIHGDLLSDESAFTVRNGRTYPSRALASSATSSSAPQQASSPQRGGRSGTMLNNASFDGRPVFVEHTELSPERAAEREEIRVMLRSREEAAVLDAKFRDTYKRQPTRVDAHSPTFDKSHAAKRFAPREPTDPELLGPSLFPLWKHWRDCGGLLQVLKDQRRLAQIQLGTGKVKYTTDYEEDFDLCWTQFDSQDLIASLKSHERELMGQVGTKSIGRLRQMRQLCEREMKMYENSIGRGVLPSATSPNAALPLSSRLAAYTPPLSSAAAAASAATAASADRDFKSPSRIKSAPFRLSLSPTLERFCTRRLTVEDSDDGNHDGNSVPQAGGGTVIASPTRKGQSIRLYDRDTVGEVMERVQAQLEDRRKEQLSLAEGAEAKTKGVVGRSPRATTSALQVMKKHG